MKNKQSKIRQQLRLKKEIKKLTLLHGANPMKRLLNRRSSKESQLKKVAMMRKKLLTRKVKLKWLNNLLSSLKTVTLMSSLMSILAANLLVKLLWNSIKRHLRLVRTSELYAQEKREWERLVKTCILRTQSSIESSLNLWLKVVISLITAVLEEKVFMDQSSKMKISFTSILDVVFFLWLTLDLELMVLNSSCVSALLLTLTTSMSCSVKLLLVLMYSWLLRDRELHLEKPSAELKLWTVVKSLMALQLPRQQKL